MKQLPSRHTFCVHHTVQPCTRLLCHFIRSHIHIGCMCVYLQPATCTGGRLTRICVRAFAVTGYRNNSQHRKLTLEKRFSCCSSQDSNSRIFDPDPGALTTELSPFPSHTRSFCSQICMGALRSTSISMVDLPTRFLSTHNK